MKGTETSSENVIKQSITWDKAFKVLAMHQKNWLTH